MLSDWKTQNKSPRLLTWVDPVFFLPVKWGHHFGLMGVGITALSRTQLPSYHRDRQCSLHPPLPPQTGSVGWLTSPRLPSLHGLAQQCYGSINQPTGTPHTGVGTVSFLCMPLTHSKSPTSGELSVQSVDPQSPSAFGT